MYLITCCCAPFRCDARACNSKILFITVMVVLVMFCWELRVLIQAVSDLFKSVRASWEYFIITSSSPIRNLNVSRTFDMFWCSWRPTDACVVIRYYKNVYICPAFLKSVLWRGVSSIALLRDLSTFSVVVSADFLCKYDRRKVFDWGLKRSRKKGKRYFWSVRDTLVLVLDSSSLVLSLSMGLTKYSIHWPSTLEVVRVKSSFRPYLTALSFSLSCLRMI